MAGGGLGGLMDYHGVPVGDVGCIARVRCSCGRFADDALHAEDGVMRNE